MYPELDFEGTGERAVEAELKAKYATQIVKETLQRIGRVLENTKPFI